MGVAVTVLLQSVLGVLGSADFTWGERVEDGEMKGILSNCRRIEVLHARIQCLTQDGRDRSLEHRKLGIFVPPRSKWADFCSGVEPVGDEIIFNKTGIG